MAQALRHDVRRLPHDGGVEAVVSRGSDEGDGDSDGDSDSDGDGDGGDIEVEIEGGEDSEDADAL